MSRFVHEVHIRWSDMDAYRHINNSAYLPYLEQARIALEEIRAASTEALDGLRASLNSLRTPGAEAPLTPNLPGLADVPALADRISRAGVAVDLDSSGQAVPVAPATDHAAYRIVQESLTNVLRHAEANRVRVTTAWTAGCGAGSVL